MNITQFQEFTGDIIRAKLKAGLTGSITVEVNLETVTTARRQAGTGLNLQLFEGEKKFIYQGITFVWS